MNDSSIRASEKTRQVVKKLRSFFECGSQNEIIQHSLVSLIDRELKRAHDAKRIDALCKMRAEIKPKIYC